MTTVVRRRCKVSMRFQAKFGPQFQYRPGCAGDLEGSPAQTTPPLHHHQLPSPIIMQTRGMYDHLTIQLLFLFILLSLLYQTHSVVAKRGTKEAPGTPDKKVCLTCSLSILLDDLNVLL